MVRLVRPNETLVMRSQTMAWSLGLVIGASCPSILAEESKSVAAPDTAALAAEYFAGALAGKKMQLQEIPADPAKLEDLRQTIYTAYSAEVRKARPDVFKAPVHLKPEEKNALSPGEYHIADGLDMPYLVFSRGEKPDGGWPLVIAMHGGGGTSDKLANPHAWTVNTREWKAQTSLAASISRAM